MVSDSRPDIELIVNYQRGEEGASDILFRRHIDRVLRLVRSRVRSEEDCKDIVQNSLLKAHASLHSFRFESTFDTWLNVIVNREIIDYSRRKAKHSPPVSLSVLEDFPSPEVDPVNSTISRSAANAIVEAIRKLPADQRQALELAINELSYEEIAEVMKKSTNQVKGLLGRARNQLRGQLGVQPSVRTRAATFTAERRPWRKRCAP